MESGAFRSGRETKSCILHVDGVECDVTPEDSKCSDADKATLLALRRRLASTPIRRSSRDWPTINRERWSWRRELDLSCDAGAISDNYQPAHNQGREKSSKKGNHKDADAAVDLNLSVIYEDYSYDSL